jgi:hypothetical protein
MNPVSVEPGFELEVKVADLNPHQVIESFGSRPNVLFQA